MILEARKIESSDSFHSIEYIPVNSCRSAPFQEIQFKVLKGEDGCNLYFIHTYIECLSENVINNANCQKDSILQSLKKVLERVV